MIKIEYVCHACLLININGKRVLTDPWIMGSCFANCLWIYPPPKKSADEIGKVDYIYFSHGHEDHFQIESINERIRLVDYQSTCENMLIEIVEILKRNEPKGAKLVKGFLRETANSFAEWRYEDNP